MEFQLTMFTVHNLNCDLSSFYLMYVFESYRSLLLSYCNIDAILRCIAVSCYCRAISCGCSHSFYHTEWLDSTATSQYERPPQGSRGPPESWSQPQPTEQGKHRTKQDPRSMPYFWCPSSLTVLHVFSCVLRYNIHLYFVLIMVQSFKCILYLAC